MSRKSISLRGFNVIMSIGDQEWMSVNTVLSQSSYPYINFKFI